MAKNEEIKLPGMDLTPVVRLVKEFGSIIFVLLFAFILLLYEMPRQRSDFKEMLTSQQTAFKEALAELRTDYKATSDQQQLLFERTIQKMVEKQPQ
jgi:hypothetical protein